MPSTAAGQRFSDGKRADRSLEAGFSSLPPHPAVRPFRIPQEILLGCVSAFCSEVRRYYFEDVAVGSHALAHGPVAAVDQTIGTEGGPKLVEPGGRRIGPYAGHLGVDVLRARQ